VNALEDLGSLGVAFVSLGDNLDLSTPSGRLMFHGRGLPARNRKPESIEISGNGRRRNQNDRSNAF
jgi:hypothetical protein